jgi:hypothetical protein
MKMTSFVVYDADTGEIVHVHSEPVAQDPTPDEAIQHAGGAAERRLEVLALGGPMPPGSFRVENGELREGGGDRGVGAGAASGTFSVPDVKRRYQRGGP